MTTARDLPSATLLSNGRVLLAGGQDDTLQPLDSAELYDPKTGTFSATGAMTAGRAADTATALSDGRVLIAGGWTTDVSILASAELYDPATGTFSLTGSMTTDRWQHTATLLEDGSVLVAGGEDDNGGLVSAERYDPASGAFSPTGSLASVRLGATATLLADGRVLVAGGYDGSTDLASAELYNPASGAFSPTGSMAVARDGQTATLLSDGRVLIAGGYDRSGALASAELYDPVTGAFSPTGSLTAARDGGTATLLADGRVLVAGGRDASFNALASADLYNPATGTFSATDPMTAARDGGTAALLADGQVLIVGGMDNDNNVLPSAELYRPTPALTPALTPAPSSGATSTLAPPTGAKPPPAPTHFTVDQRPGRVACPSADASGVICNETDDFAWRSSADPTTWFRIYEAETGEGPGPITCFDVNSAGARLVLETKPGARSAQLIAEMSVGGGEACFWLTAVSDAEESSPVAVTLLGAPLAASALTPTEQIQSKIFTPPPAATPVPPATPIPVPSPGPASYAVTGGGNTTLVYGKDVTDNSGVTTDSASTATVDMGDGDSVDLAPNSSLVVQTPSLFTLLKGKLHLFWQGLLKDNVSHPEPRIQGLTAIMSVRGTELVVATTADATIVQVLEGQVTVSDLSGQGTVNLATGQQITVAAGAVPTQSQVVPATNVDHFWASSSAPFLPALVIGGMVILVAALALGLLWRRRRRASRPTPTGYPAPPVPPFGYSPPPGSYGSPPAGPLLPGYAPVGGYPAGFGQAPPPAHWSKKKSCLSCLSLTFFLIFLVIALTGFLIVYQEKNPLGLSMPTSSPTATPIPTPTPLDNPTIAADILKACTSKSTLSACQTASLAGLNQARVKEGLAPEVLPAGFWSLPYEQQLFYLVNSERTSRSLPPFDSIYRILNGDALKGAQADKDPPLSVGAALSPFSAWVGSWGNGDTTVELVFAWVYDDGPNGGVVINDDCVPTDMTGCWGHREGALYEFGPYVILGNTFNSTLAFGAACTTEKEEGWVGGQRLSCAWEGGQVGEANQSPGP
jgi:hypothetical protein